MEDDLHRAQARRIRDLEQRLAERTRVLDDAAAAMAGESRRREEAQEALHLAQRVETVGHLVGGLSHDLRNVLLAVTLGYQVLEERTDDPEAQEVARNGRLAIGQAGDLVDRMLGLMRPGGSEQAATVEVSPWLRSMEDLLGYAAGRAVRCRVRAGPEVWPVDVNEHALGAALVNLAVNARDAMPDGGELTVAAENLPRGAPRPATVPDEDLVRVSVTDTGCGMVPEVLARATELLFTTKPPGKGTGLGLHMVRSFVNGAAGTLRLLSEPGQGTTVELYLPRTPGQEAVQAGAAPVAGPAVAGTLLLVEDDDLLRPGVAAMLASAGFEVLQAHSAEVAMALVAAVPRLALVVSEVGLEGASGAALVRRLRMERPGLPALFISGHDLPGSPLGGARLLRKPFTRAQLLAAVEAALASPVVGLDDAAAMLDRLMVRLRSPELMAAVLQWRDARGAARLPPLAAVQAQLPPGLLEHVFVAAVEGPEDALAFRYLSVGAALTEALGRAPEAVGPVETRQSTLGTLASAYQRAARSGLPSYEYARYALDGAAPVLFERLILPASADGRRVSHLLGLVLFTNLTRHPGAGPEPAPPAAPS